MRTRLLQIAGVLFVVAGLATAGLDWFLSGDRVRTAVERQASDWLGQPVRIESASARLFPRIALRLRNVSVGTAVTLARVDLSTGLRALLSRRIEDAELVVADSRLEMPLPFGFPVGGGAPAEDAAAGSDDEVSVGSIRAITLENLTLASRGREIELDAESSLAGSTLTITAARAASGDTVIEATGKAELGKRVEVTLDAKANQLDLDDLVALAAAFTQRAAGEDASTSPGVPAAVTATFAAPRGRFADVEIQRIEATVLADGAEVRIEPLAFDVFGGRFDGWTDVSFSDELDVRIGAGVANMDVAQLAAYGGVKDAITGRLYGSGRFGARGADVAGALATARGVGEVKITDGTIRNLGLVRTVMEFFGRPGTEAPPSSGDRFTSLDGSFALADGSLRSDDLTLHSPDGDIFAKGTVDLASKAVDARAELVVSEELSAQAGRDFYRYAQSAGRIILPATITGELGAPSIGIDAGAVLRRGLRNEVEGRLRDLFERFKPGAR